MMTSSKPTTIKLRSLLTNCSNQEEKFKASRTSLKLHTSI